MLISHISDIHLGYTQFNLLEREEDLYEVFEESIDKSIAEHANAIVLAGDIFHNPKPNGAAVIRLARELKKLKDKSIPVYFILGEHDLSRTNDVPLPYLFHNLGLARRLRPDSPIQLDNLLIYGFNKERRSNMENGLLKPFKKLENTLINDVQRNSIENKKLKKILVLHQGLSDFNKFAGEIFSSDLPKGFDYYAMGHYHDHIEKRFSELDNNLVSYPGSIDLGHNEAIAKIDKGFLLVDLSGTETVNTEWIRLDKRRPQINYVFDYEQLEHKLDDIIKESETFFKKPVLDLKLVGKQIDPKILSNHLSKLDPFSLYYTWQIIEEQESISGYSFDNSNEFDIEKELSNLVSNSLNSKTLSNLSLDIINMINDGGNQDNVDKINKNKSRQIASYLWDYFENNKHIYQQPESLIEKKGSEIN